MTDTNPTDDTEARAFEAGLRARMRWEAERPGLSALLMGKIRLGDVSRGMSGWWAHPGGGLEDVSDDEHPARGRHPTREAAQAALVDAAVAAIMGGGA